MKRRQFVLLSLILAVTLVVSGGIVPTVARSEPTALVAPSLSEIAQSPPTPYFTNVTDEVGLTDVTGFRVSIADMNGDGYPDLLLHQIPESLPSGCETCKEQVLYLNEKGSDPGDPHSRKFRDDTAASGIRASRRGTQDRRSNLAVFADVDNDGDLDLFTGLYTHRLENYTDNGDRNDLLLNDGSGHFTLAPNSPFHLERLWNTTSATFLDYNLDGNVDLFVGNFFTKDWAGYFKDQLYRGNGDGTFENVTASAGLDFASPGHWQPTYAVSAADTNDDGLMDLFASNYCRGHSIHWQNNGDGTFSQVQESTHYGQHIGELGAFATYNTCSWGSMPRDFDNDGDVDFFEIITHGHGDGGLLDGAFSRHSTVLVNKANVFSWDFSRVSGRARDDTNIRHHGDHHASWFDIDNDGLSDFVLTESAYDNNGLYLFKQAVDNTFHLVTSEAGLDSINAAKLPSHNVIPFDYDLDGDEDLLIGFDGKDEGIQLWRNDVGNRNHWLTIVLEGAGIPGRSNKSAIGARVQVTAGGKTYTRDVYAGNGHFGPQAPLSLTFGLGQATKVDKITVHWPNERRTSRELGDIAVDQFIKINELHTWDQQAKLTAESDAAVGDKFGWSVGIWGDTAVVGAPGKNRSAGAAYVFQRSGVDWGQPIKLSTSGIEPGDQFGQSIDISRDTIIVGAPGDDDEEADAGAAYVFQWNGTTWSLQEKLTAQDGAVARGDFGWSVGIIGNVIVVGAPAWTGGAVGSAYVFQRSGSTWGQPYRLPASGGLFGWFVATSGLFVIVGAPFDNGQEGSTYIFQRSGTNWILQEKLEHMSMPGTLFGSSVAIRGGIALVGARWDYRHVQWTDGPRAGSVHVFEWSRSGWDLLERWSGETEEDEFGFSVSIGDWYTIVIGAPFHDHVRTDSGIAYSFKQSVTGRWDEVTRPLAGDAGSSDRFGWSTDMGEDTAVIGAPFDDYRGAAYVYKLEGLTAIDLLSFTAQAGDDRVTLGWETGTEVDNAGFNLWRSEAADGEYAQINDALIPAEGGAVSGATYTYDDADMVQGVTYYYKLEDVDVHGVSTFHGPVSVTLGHIRYIYLPLVLK